MNEIDRNAEKIVISNEKVFTNALCAIVQSAREHTYRAANLMQVASNWLIGWRIVEQGKQGRERADYGKYILQVASDTLTQAFGTGYSLTNVKNFVRFYNVFPNEKIGQIMSDQFMSVPIGQAMSDQSLLSTIGAFFPQQLSWSHYERLIRVTDSEARAWYMHEAATQQWDYRTLKRNIESQYYYRLLQTPDGKKAEVTAEMCQLTADYQQEKSVFIKNPMLVEFLGIQQDTSFSENSLETAIISHLQHFLMELGKGYAFVARQQHIHTQDDDYYIDLVFYNYILKCFVLIDLKTTKVSYQDVGQMEMYLKMYDRFKRTDTDNPTIGIILCSETNADVVQYSSLASNPQMYAAKYLTYMPTQEQLRYEIEQQKELFALQQNSKL